MERKAVRAVVLGRVQGVNFRGSMRQEAAQLGVAGWVRNLPDGAVEFLAEGEVSAVDRLVAWAHRGPTLAGVVRVDVMDSVFTGEFAGFDIRR